MYKEAVDHYTKAIEEAKENPNHVYFANRANAYIELNEFEKAIEDSNQAIQIEN